MKIDRSDIFDKNITNMGDVSKNREYKITNMGDVSKNSKKKSSRVNKGAKSIFEPVEIVKTPDPWEPMLIDDYYKSTN
jgi:hypothetical protein